MATLRLQNRKWFGIIMNDEYVVEWVGIDTFNTREDAVAYAQELSKKEENGIIKVVLHRCIWDNLP